MKNNKKKGFTIVELVIVIAVIGILAGVLIPTFSSVSRKAKESAALQEVTAAHTTILTEEDANLTGDEYYFVIFDKDGTVDYLFTLNDDGKPEMVKADKVNTIPLTIDANDVVYTAKDGSVPSAWTIADGIIEFKEYEALDDDGKAAAKYYTHVENEDLNNVVVLVKHA